MALNLTVTEARSFGFVTAYPSGTARPNASNLNYAAGQTVPNMVVVKVGAGGKVTLANTSSGSAQLIADIAGYFVNSGPTGAGRFTAMAPTRLLDTRTGIGASGLVPANGSIDFQVSGRAGISSRAEAVVLNVTVTEARSFGFVTGYPTGSARPNASNLNYAAGQTVPNLVVVKIGAGGKVTLSNTSSGAVQLIADVAGFFEGGAGARYEGAFNSLAPNRVLDTRSGNGAVGPVRANGSVDLQVTGRGGVPAAGVSAVILNVTVTEARSFGFVTAYPAGTSRPNASNLNYVTAQTVPNLVVVKVGAGGKVSLSNTSSGTAHLIADVAGYFQSGVTGQTSTTKPPTTTQPPTTTRPPSTTQPPTTTRPPSTTQPPTGFDWSQASVDQIEQIAVSMLAEKVNAYRQNAGLAAIPMVDQYNADSKAWSVRMSETGVFEHDKIQAGWQGGVFLSTAMENIAMRYTQVADPKAAAVGLAEGFFSQWKNSSGHNENMLNGNLNAMSFGIEIGPDGRTYATMRGYGVSSYGAFPPGIYFPEPAQSYFGVSGLTTTNTDYTGTPRTQSPSLPTLTGPTRRAV